MPLFRTHSADLPVPVRTSNAAWWVAVLLIAVWYLPFTQGAIHAGFRADDALYLLMADWFATDWREDPVLLYVQSVSHLSPLYSLVLAAVGGGSSQLDIAHLLQTAFFILAVFLHGRVLARIHGQLSVGLLLMAVLALAPASLLYNTEIWSEFLYLALIAGGILAALAARDRPAWWLLSALLIGLAAVTRGFGIVAIIALLMVTAVRARKYLLPVTIICLAPLVLADLLGLGGGRDYLEIFNSRISGDTRLLHYMQLNIQAIAPGWYDVFSVERGAAAVAVSGVLGILALIGVCVRFWRFELDAVYTAGYMALLILWPFPVEVERFVYGLAPMIIIQASCGAAVLGAMINARTGQILAVLPVAALFVWVVGTGGSMGWRYLMHTPPSDIQSWRASRYWLEPASLADAEADIRMRQAMIDMLSAITERIPVKSCIYTMHPQAVMFYSRRIAWPQGPQADDMPRPECKYQVLFGEDEVLARKQLVWPGAVVLDVARAEKGIAAIFFHYPDP